MQPHPIKSYIAVGANLGDREANIRSAIDALNYLPGTRVTRVSKLIENPAIGGPQNSPDFLNGVIEIDTTLDPNTLLQQLLTIEQKLGRTRREKWEPRLIDLDLLLFRDQIISSNDLTLPHPLMHTRRFVLEPLAELAPDLMHPVLRKSIRELFLDL
jgi:2-amino-4-hydroxy-6-hydroxymethyldihydropteridine diphosphokinase